MIKLFRATGKGHSNRNCGALCPLFLFTRKVIIILIKVEEDEWRKER